jgi:excisionase family DNA binding protein
MAGIEHRDNGAAAERTPLSEPLLTADEVAALLRVPRSTVYELTRTCRLPHIKVGRRTLFVRMDLDAWVVANRVTPRT